MEPFPCSVKAPFARIARIEHLVGKQILIDSAAERLDSHAGSPFGNYSLPYVPPYWTLEVLILLQDIAPSITFPIMSQENCCWSRKLFSTHIQFNDYGVLLGCLVAQII